VIRFGCSMNSSMMLVSLVLVVLWWLSIVTLWVDDRICCIIGCL
jgi:hypothetical protein